MSREVSTSYEQLAVAGYRDWAMGVELFLFIAFVSLFLKTVFLERALCCRWALRWEEQPCLQAARPCRRRCRRRCRRCWGERGGAQVILYIPVA